ncbi:type 2 isopentenyl-diphosphate Delta-isomerase [Carboxydocella sp. ULO1]|uniref:type 2 isopentenyl-diphosphate Delta-isomerase n=1 Tax=Carboxydocella sp. ULO1 TaxID=1926599 RepID=UPI0009ADDA76|nr:type 2 isopentenyl-diphosphate Delta-isomerase [Carboxydocella sp. ULO1]GAW28629.1 isopentenyl pyrophosphate isomerase [Carboxydocella sp. ULO1]
MLASIEIIQLRKDEHLQICIENDVEYSIRTTGFENLVLSQQSLPEVDFTNIDLTCEIAGKKLYAPIIISAMTGGTDYGHYINRNLAAAAQELGVAMVTGSQRIAIEYPQFASFFQIRDIAPDILLFGNLGVVQLNSGYGINECQQAVDMIGADGLTLHLNVLQELIQPGGNTNFKGLYQKLRELVERVNFPIIVKEVGFGLSKQTIESLVDINIMGIDVAGAGGTSWIKIENLRREATLPKEVLLTLESLAISTYDSLQIAVARKRDKLVIASGGIRTGVDAVKALIIGADLVGMALPLLKPATESAAAVKRFLENFIWEMKVAMCSLGVETLKDLKKVGFNEVGGKI